MESRVPPTDGHNHEEDPHNVGLHSVVEGEDEHHHEKKSMLTKVKDKAKKMKETFKNRGLHGQDQEHDHKDDHTEEEDEDVDEKMMNDPEVHGAPIYESAAMRSAVPVEPRVNLEKPTAVEEDRYDSKIVDPPVKPFDQLQEENTGQTRGNLGMPTSVVEEDRYDSKIVDPQVKPFEQLQEENTGKPRGNLGMPTSVVKDHVPEEKPVSYSPETYGTKVTETSGNLGQVRKENMGQPIGRGTGLEEDPNSPKDGSIPKYQAKTTDPTGVGEEETGITPIVQSFSKMGISDEKESKSKAGQEQTAYEGSDHDQLSPDPLSSTKTTASPGSKNYEPTSKPQDLPPDTLIADKAVSAKDAIASNLGYGGKVETGSQEMQGQDTAAKSSSPKEDAHKIAATVPGTETGHEGGEKGPFDKGVSAKGYWDEKFRPSDEDKALSEVISGALYKRKEEPEKEGNANPMGKVTESEEVARKLGTGEDNSSEGDNIGVAAAPVGNVGVVDRVKGVVGSWFGKGDDSSQGSPGTTYVGGDGVPSSAGGKGGHGQDVPGEPRSEEPSN